MSTTISAVIINLLVTVLPFLGVTVGSDDLTKAVQVLVAIATGLWIWYQRTTLQQAPDGVGDVGLSGIKK